MGTHQQMQGSRNAEKCSSSWSLHVPSKKESSHDALFWPSAAEIARSGLQLWPSVDWQPTLGTFVYPRENPAENQVPEPLKKFVNQIFTSAKTNGNGACSIHALLGRAHHGELYCQNDREVIKTSFERGLREHSARVEIYTLLAAWWGGGRGSWVRVSLTSGMKETKLVCYGKHCPHP